MSYHSNMTWAWTDPVTDEVIDEIVRGCLANQEYHRTNSFIPGFHGIPSQIDVLIFKAERLLDAPNVDIAEHCASAPDPAKAVAILTRVIDRITKQATP